MRLPIAFGSRTLKVEVLQVADNVRKDDAAGMYPGDSGVTPPYCILLARLRRANFMPSFIF